MDIYSVIQAHFSVANSLHEPSTATGGIHLAIFMLCLYIAHVFL